MPERLQPAASSDLSRLDPIVGKQINSIADAYRDQRRQIGLFCGPDSAGKTLAARVLGHLLGYPVYRIDLSGVVTKYIGETEKNLARSFEAVESSDVILMFDEGDALFGRRGEVADSHDRYANQEVSYLLQHLGNFDGLAILTTRLRDDTDPALLRRFSWTIDFPPPASGGSMPLWQKFLRRLRASG